MTDDGDLHQLARDVALLKDAIPRLERALGTASSREEARLERLSNLENRVTEIEVTQKVMVSTVTSLTDAVKWVNKTIIGAMILAIIAFMLSEAPVLATLTP